MSFFTSSRPNGSLSGIGLSVSGKKLIISRSQRFNPSADIDVLFESNQTQNRISLSKCRYVRWTMLFDGNYTLEDSSRDPKWDWSHREY